ncbi:MAG TPA: DegT/DnrJ/EryC1/StrS family aminotransferase [Myxococcota bacterium]|nr:DegT/DnrJ/EryC1/StrS family aminotransferase [Myxococcota bacterium]HRY96788.1 DegT/DnrJ/EryC1/StrS family aminotransferase [Myxococcota bacterium]HSA23354.1 DegT/DnrJ/EryC1/StrS family aminotransferase [Myxococcota bacterium]
MPPASEPAASPPEPGVPLFDLARQHRPLRAELLAALEAVVDSGQFIHGPAVARLEAALGAALGARHVLGVSSGTDALLLGLMALGIGPGDEVVVPAFTFVASANVVARLGARPVFADVHPAELVLTPEELERRLSPRTRAVIPVHLFGLPCRVDELVAQCAPRDIPVLEDCAQATFARLGARQVGSFGRLGAFSFFPTKNLGGFGDGGALSVADGELLARLRRLRDQGGRARDDYTELGGNFRLDTLQAAVLEVKLRRAEAWQAERRAVAGRYAALFSQAGLGAPGDERLQLPPCPAGREHAWNLYVVQAARREELRAHLQTRGVGAGVYYSRPLHLQPCFAPGPGRLPAAERAAERVLALPCYPGLTPPEQERVVAAVAEFARA